MKPHERAEYEIAKATMEKGVPAMLGAYPSIAKLTMTYYKELVKEGFNEQQALYIVAKQGYLAGPTSSE
ncbi:hypothetical protein [Priestia megaterium]|uniref:hypothetical protein n=1 Tax=Priestia megaterium TaxID=1404 RepID=UPI000BF41E72|nr:hypothetical protein [Priestia megaterium]PFR93485.1 hypothetical protein COK39_17495 [Priestia megaterium]